MRICCLALLSLLSMVSSGLAQDEFDRRAREIVGKMTLDEKISQLHGIRDDEKGIYRWVPGVPRLGIPSLQVTNGPAGAGPGSTRPPRPQAPATALPSPIAAAATWDRAMAEDYGAIAGEESKAIGNGLLEAPTINIVRIPQNGRTFEGYGEDPYLAGEMSVANITGIQSAGIIANVKHYIANNQETDRFTVNEEIDERTIREIYLPAFEASILRGHSASVMCAYPKINGTFNCENSTLLKQILKQEWRFDGFVTSDFGAVHSTVPSAMAGLDLEMPTGKYFGDDLKAAVESGKVPMLVIDDKLVRRFRTMMKFGIFDNPPQPHPIPDKENGARARRIAEEGVVLLKNSAGLLPLDAEKIKSIALIGPMATKAVTGGGGSSHVVPLYTVDPADGIRTGPRSNLIVVVADGTDIQHAVNTARAADIAVVMVGKIDTEGKDQSLELGEAQDKLVEGVAAANPKTVVVLKTGSAVFMPWLEKVSAVLEAWYPGEEDGNVVARVLFGDVNPSGKLPITFPRGLGDVAANTAAQYPGVDATAHYSEGVLVGYRHYDAKNITPLFPFGHGLSYTTFAYRNLKIAPTVSAGNTRARLTVELDVQNSGKVAGAEVIQLYLGLPSSAQVPQPPKQLKRFQKVDLKPGASAHVRFTADPRDLSYWDVNRHAWQLMPGVYKVLIGSSSRDIRLQGIARIH